MMRDAFSLLIPIPVNGMWSSSYMNKQVKRESLYNLLCYIDRKDPLVINPYNKKEAVKLLHKQRLGYLIDGIFYADPKEAEAIGQQFKLFRLKKQRS
jgi:hypothetical protein